MPCAHRFRRLDLDFIAMTLLVKKVKDSFWDPSHGCRRLIGIAQEWPTSEQSARNSGENIIAFHRLQTARKRKKLSTGSRARTLSRSSSRRSPHNLSSMASQIVPPPACAFWSWLNLFPMASFSIQADHERTSDASSTKTRATDTERER